MGKLKEVLDGLQQRRDRMIADLNKIKRLADATEDKNERTEDELLKLKKKFEQDNVRKEGEHQAYENELHKLETEEERLQRSIDEINAEIRSAERGISADTHLAGSTKDNKKGLGRAANDNRKGLFGRASNDNSQNHGLGKTG